MMNILLTVCMIVGLGTILRNQAEPQTYKSVSIVQSKADGSPLLISGTVTAIESESPVRRSLIKRNVLLTNASSKGILLTVVQLSVSGLSLVNVNATLENDYFFSAEVFSPSSTQNYEQPFGPVTKTGTSAKAEEATQPRALASVKFVQFADGSTWGIPLAGKHALDERQLLWQELRVLADTYQTKGANEFVAKLRQPSSLAVITNMQHLYAETHNPVIVSDKVSAMLRQASEHMRGMRR